MKHSEIRCGGAGIADTGEITCSHGVVIGRIEGDTVHKCPVSLQNIVKGRNKGDYQYRDTFAISFCPWCGKNLHYQKYLTPGFMKFLKDQGFTEKQIYKAWKVIVSLFDDPTSNTLADKDTMQIFCTDLLRNSNPSFIVEEFLLKETS